ncbi:phosphoethanolamine transferase [Gellertiella hungarica]|uniref:Heptose-I-phosphate ethanolaminephosphotransferase n=1 Tax=Gellertiella hungarica TaxID=1572859 RepID=A0A7W6J3K0_9HYPH|nr:phosphoethanolamine transferase [Gellertiella hungarica]MBB4063437.1 heptose-I-phosphate ethanolaminephosphotransferase [Gellertiella hungarica]
MPFSAGFILAVLAAALASMAALAGMPGRDIATMMLLPVLMVLMPLGLRLLGQAAGRFGAALYGLWLAAWFAGFVTALGLRLRYGLGPMDERVVQALAGTDGREAREYALELAPLIGLVVLGCGLAGIWGGRYVWRVLAPLPGPALRTRLLLGPLLAILPLALHGNAVVERSDPLTLARVVGDEVFSHATETSALRADRQEAQRHVAEWRPIYRGPQERVVVLVIGESANRANWSLYGYPRRTNPRLEALSDELLVFRDVISSYGSTAVELPRMLTLADREGEHDWRRQPSVINLARRTGYRTWWITNQSFVLAAAAFGQDCDRFVSVYEGRYGRHDRSLDSKLIPPLEAALADPAPLKFIVLHMLGSHPDYVRRYPPLFDIFGHEHDAVDDMLANRWFWVRQKRNEYDNSILFTDWVLASAIEALRQAPQAEASLFFLSDHGQDVGHFTSSWGHQFHYESGFTIPALFWKKGQVPDRSFERRPYQSDRFDTTLLSLLGIRTLKDDPRYDLMGAAFRPWQRKIDGVDYVPGVSNVPGG